MVVGLFIWFVSIGSVGFLVMFILSVMFGWDKFWVLLVFIVFLNGVGCIFGFDYWVVFWF